MKYKIIDKSKKFIGLSTDALDRALNNMAIQIERLSKMEVPHKDGQLQSSGGHRRTGVLKYWIEYTNRDYALYQHEGGDGKRVVRNYSKAGKKKHYLIDPANKVKKQINVYLKQQTDRIKL